jgi:hypothetical protein
VDSPHHARVNACARSSQEDKGPVEASPRPARNLQAQGPERHPRPHSITCGRLQWGAVLPAGCFTNKKCPRAPHALGVLPWACGARQGVFCLLGGGGLHGLAKADERLRQCQGNELFIKLAFTYKATTQCPRTDRKPRSAHVTVLSALDSALAATAPPRTVPAPPLGVHRGGH